MSSTQKVISLGDYMGKLKSGSGSLFKFKEDKRNKVCPGKRASDLCLEFPNLHLFPLYFFFGQCKAKKKIGNLMAKILGVSTSFLPTHVVVNNSFARHD